MSPTHRQCRSSSLRESEMGDRAGCCSRGGGGRDVWRPRRPALRVTWQRARRRGGYRTARCTGRTRGGLEYNWPGLAFKQSFSDFREARLKMGSRGRTRAARRGFAPGRELTAIGSW